MLKIFVILAFTLGTFLSFGVFSDVQIEPQKFANVAENIDCNVCPQQIVADNTMDYIKVNSQLIPKNENGKRVAYRSLNMPFEVGW